MCVSLCLYGCLSVYLQGDTRVWNEETIEIKTLGYCVSLQSLRRVKFYDYCCPMTLDELYTTR